MGHTYVIRQTFESASADNEVLYWNNHTGWGSRETADTFSDTQRDNRAILNLPMGGEWVLVPRRFKDALAITQGACNPSGIARSLADACSECIRQNEDQRTDPAVRLIAHQLAYLLKVRELDDSLTAYGEALSACEAKVAEVTR